MFNQLADHYDESFMTAEALAENTVAFERLGDLSNRSVLDCGCGTGLLLEYVKVGGYLGIDIAAAMLDRASQKFPGRNFLLGDMADLRGIVGNGTYDLVVSTFGSFSYCTQPGNAVREMHRVLKPGGRVYLMAFGDRYRTRKTHVAKDITYLTYSADELKLIFHQCFPTVNVWGMNAIAGVLGPVLGERLTTVLMRLEAKTLGRFAPDLSYFMMVEAVR